MNVKKIDSCYTPPYYDLYSPQVELPRETAAQGILTHSKDTIAPATGSDNPFLLDNVFADTSSPFKTKTIHATETTKTTQHNKTEIYQRQMYIECVKTQQASREEDIEISNETLKQAQQANKTIQNEIADRMSENIRSAKTSKILKWVNRIFTGIATIAGFACIAISIATAGVALPAALAAVSAGASVCSGALAIVRGILDYKNKRTVGEVEEKKATRHLLNQKIKTVWEEMHRFIENIFDLWKQLARDAKNWLAAALSK